MTDYLKELSSLRVGVARIAQAIGLQDEIPGGKSDEPLPFEELSRRAYHYDRGWNRLCAFIVSKIQEDNREKEALAKAGVKVFLTRPKPE